MQELVEAHEELPVEEAGGGREKEAGEEPQKPIPQPNPINLNPNATIQPKNNQLPLYILPSPTSQSQPKTPVTKAKASLTLPALKSLKKLVATVQNFATTSNTLATTQLHDTAVGSGAGSDLEHLNLDISKLHQFQKPPKA